MAGTWKFTALSTQCHCVMQHSLPVVLLLCIEKWIFPAEVSSLEKDGFSNSSFAAISATQRDGVAHLCQHRLALALKEPKGFSHQQKRPPKELALLFSRESPGE